ncbi:MAG: MBL fold metallo-hydrolase [Lachnospiraceae bacterium]|jgi:hydroxyacylglutathione hydrolase
MGEIRINCVKVGMLATNCYLVYDEDEKRAVVCDPGDNAEFIADCVEKLGLEAEAIFLTHAHMDHIQAVDELKEKYAVPVYVHEADEPMLKSTSYNMGCKVITLTDEDVRLKGGEVLNIGKMEIHVIHTPGHTPGGVCYYFPAGGFLLSGDTMFRYSWGRTDFPGGSERDLMKSIREKLLPLPEETIVYPGHEGATKIGDERRVHRYEA